MGQAGRGSLGCCSSSQLEEWIQRQEGSTENQKFAYLFLRLDFFFFKGGGKGHEQHFQVQNMVYQDRKTLAVCGDLIRLSLVWRIMREEVGTVVGCTMGRVSMSCSILNDDQKQTLSTRLTGEQRF